MVLWRPQHRTRRGTRRPRLGVNAEHANYRWWALSCTSFGMLLATVNSGTLIIALPNLERALNASLLELVWVIIAYINRVDRARHVRGPALRPVRPQAARTSPGSSSSRSRRLRPASPRAAAS